MEEVVDSRRGMIEELFSIKAITAEERDDMLAGLEKEQDFEVKTVQQQFIPKPPPGSVTPAPAAAPTPAGTDHPLPVI